MIDTQKTCLRGETPGNNRTMIPVFGKVTMHPDDFAGQMSWVTAKRFHETAGEKTRPEKTVFYRYL